MNRCEIAFRLIVYRCQLIVIERARRKLKIPNAEKHLAVARRIIESSESEEDSEPKLPLKYATKHSTKKRLTDDIIELTSSSEGCGQAMPQRSRTNSKKASRENFPPYLTQEDDGAILILYVTALLCGSTE